MKKIIILLAILACGVGEVKAGDWPGTKGLYLLCAEQTNPWNVDTYDENLKFVEYEDKKFRATVPGSYVTGNDWKFRFRVKENEWYNVGPNDNSEYTFGSYYSANWKNSTGYFVVSKNEDAKYIQVFCDWKSDHFDVSAVVVTEQTEYNIAFMNDLGWAENAKVYGWFDNLGLTTSWPGAAMTNTNGIYTATINGLPGSKIKFSNNGVNAIGEFDLVQNAVYKTDGKVGDQSVSIGTTGYATFSSDYPLYFPEGDDATVKAYKASVDGNRIKLTRVTGGVPAKTGLFVAGTTTNVSPYATVSSVENNLMLPGEGTTVQSDATYDYYVLAKKAGGDICFSKLSESTGANVGVGKAYLRVSHGTFSSSAPSLSIFFDDAAGGTTAIDAVKSAEPAVTDGAYYNLAGQRVTNPTKGLYIVNGRKVVVK